MKAEVIRNDLAVSGVDADDRMETRDGRLYWRVGAEIDHPRAYLLCINGDADPADDECRDRVEAWRQRHGITREMSIHARERLAKGIHPDDFDRYDAGEIVGYNDDGSYKPGPNWPGDDEDDEDDDE